MPSMKNTRFQAIEMIALAASLVAACQAVPTTNAKSTADLGTELVEPSSGNQGGTGGAQQGGGTGAIMISGTVTRPDLAIIGNAGLTVQSVVGGPLRFGIQALSHVPGPGARVMLIGSDGKTPLTGTVSADSQGRFGFPHVAGAVGTFFVEAQIDAEGRTYSFRGLANRQAADKTETLVDIASTLVATKLVYLTKSGELKLEAVTFAAADKLVRSVRDSITKEQVPFMGDGSSDSLGAMDQLGLDDVDVGAWVGRIGGRFAAPAETWAVAKVVDSDKLVQLGIYGAVPDVAKAGTFAVDGAGNLYFPTVTGTSSIQVFKVTPAGDKSAFSTLPAEVTSPVSLAFGPEGKLYAASYQAGPRQICLYQGTDSLSLAATASWTAAGVPAVSQLAVGIAGTSYLAVPSHHAIVRLSVDPAKIKIFGKVGQAGHKDGQPADAQFRSPSGVAVASDGTAFVGDAGNFVLRKIDPEGAVSTIAGKAGDGISRGGRAAYARFGSPGSVAVRGATVYVTDGGPRIIGRLTPDGSVFRVAGKGGAGSAEGQGHVATFGRPEALAADDQGALYVRDAKADASGNIKSFVFRKITRQ